MQAIPNRKKVKTKKFVINYEIKLHLNFGLLNSFLKEKLGEKKKDINLFQMKIPEMKSLEFCFQHLQKKVNQLALNHGYDV